MGNCIYQRIGTIFQWKHSENSLKSLDRKEGFNLGAMQEKKNL